MNHLSRLRLYVFGAMDRCSFYMHGRLRDTCECLKAGMCIFALVTLFHGLQPENSLKIARISAAHIEGPTEIRRSGQLRYCWASLLTSYEVCDVEIRQI